MMTFSIVDENISKKNKRCLLFHNAIILKCSKYKGLKKKEGVIVISGRYSDSLTVKNTT